MKTKTNEKKNVCPNELQLPTGAFSSGNCVGCRYWYPSKKDSNGRDYCSYYDTYYYPRERGGCLSRED